MCANDRLCPCPCAHAPSRQPLAMSLEADHGNPLAELKQGATDLEQLLPFTTFRRVLSASCSPAPP